MSQAVRRTKRLNEPETPTISGVVPDALPIGGGGETDLITRFGYDFKWLNEHAGTQHIQTELVDKWIRELGQSHHATAKLTLQDVDSLIAMRRRMHNRDAAANTRAKGKDYMAFLEKQLLGYAAVKQQLAEANATIAQLRQETRLVVYGTE